MVMDEDERQVGEAQLWMSGEWTSRQACVLADGQADMHIRLQLAWRMGKRVDWHAQRQVSWMSDVRMYRRASEQSDNLP